MLGWLLRTTTLAPENRKREHHHNPCCPRSQPHDHTTKDDANRLNAGMRWCETFATRVAEGAGPESRSNRTFTGTGLEEGRPLDLVATFAPESA